VAKESDKIIEQTLNRISSGNSKFNSDTYYYVRHYDVQIYRNRRIDYENGLIKKKWQVNGRIECGPFKEDSIPLSMR
jgi:hypothetical protein